MWKFQLPDIMNYMLEMVSLLLLTPLQLPSDFEWLSSDQVRPVSQGVCHTERVWRISPTVYESLWQEEIVS